MRKLKLKPFQPTEFEEQNVVVAWARLHENREPRLKLLNASLAGVNLPLVVAVRCKAAGYRAGYLDLFLPVPSRGFHGQFIEMKRLQGGRVSPDQKWWIDQLERQGYRVTVAKGAGEGIAALKWYLDYDDGTK